MDPSLASRSGASWPVVLRRWSPAPGRVFAWLAALWGLGVAVSWGLARSLDAAFAFWGGSAVIFLGLWGLLLQLARRRQGLRILVMLLTLGNASFALLLYVAALSIDLPPPEDALPALQPSASFLGGCVVAVAASLACLAVPVRRFVSRFIPIDPDDFVHAYALALAVAVTGLSFLNLAPTGTPFIYPLLEASEFPLEANDALISNITMASVTLWSLPTAFLAVGLGHTRNLGQALSRLGIRQVSGRAWSVSAGFVLALVGAGIGVGLAIEELWTRFGWPTTDADLFAELANLPVHPLGMLLLAISAGVSEELLVRGVLQTRLGLVLSNLLFTAAHAFQYATDALVMVLILGFAFGFLRQRYGLLPAIVVHALYNFLLLLVSTQFDMG